MKRIALLIGAVDDEKIATGTALDITNYKKFLTSEIGGAWNDQEVIIERILTKESILSSLKKIKGEFPDFAFVVFTGHGGYRNDSSNNDLYVNENEFIKESDLDNIASRQITILDCCRSCVISELNKAIDSTEMFSEGGNFSIRKLIRKHYNDRMMQAAEQEVRLYACKKDSYAHTDDDEGGVFSKYLLQTAKDIQREDYMPIKKAFNKAQSLTFYETKEKQTPSYKGYNLHESQQLIISLNPKTFQLMG